jgi:16S rRNA (adenine1518-N6/adenine1519-N6)-dimethyltransferase
MKLSDMRRLLEAGDIRLTKSLGQNFLHDRNQLRRIVGAAELTRADKVLEVGPGLGPLTERLVAEAGEVWAIEKDPRLVEFLCRHFADALNSYRQESDVSARILSKRPLTPPLSPSDGERVVEDRMRGCPGPTGLKPSASPARRPVLRLIHADALKFLRDGPRDWRDWKLVANLPYSVASPILVELAQALHPPERMVVTLQLEVAQRLMASAGAEDYGILTLLLQLRYEPRCCFKIPANCFFPAPKVDSACVTLLRRDEPLLNLAEAATFTRIVKRSFSQRRKMMLKLLKEDWPAEALRSGFAEAGLSDSARAESVTLDQFVTLTRCLAPGGDAQA